MERESLTVVEIYPQERNLHQWVPDAHRVLEDLAGVRRGTGADTVRIQGRIDRVPAAGGIVRLAAGEYTVSATLTGKGKLVLRGAGMGATVLKQAAGANLSSLLSFPDGADGFTVEDLTLDGNQAQNTARCIALSVTTCDDWAVRRVEIRHVSGPPTPGPPGICLGISGSARNYAIQDCWIHDSGVPRGAASDGLYTAGWGGRITGNRIDGISDTGIVYEAVGSSSADPSAGTVIANNAITNTVNGIAVDAAIASSYGAGCSVTGNTIERFGTTVADDVCAGIYVLKAAGAGYQIDVAVTGNVVRESTHARGIRLEGVSDVAVTGNVVTFCSTEGGLEGIGAFLCERLAVTGGIVKDNGGFGLGLQGCTNGTVTGVVFWGNSALAGLPAPANLDVRKSGAVESTGLVVSGCRIANATTGYGLQLSDATTALVDGNDLTGNPSGAVNNASTGAVRFGINLSGSDARAAGIIAALPAINFGTMGTGTFNEQSVTVTGAATTDAAYASPVAGLEAGLIWSAYVSAADTVTVRMFNNSGGTVDPVNRDWRVVVVKH